MSDKKKPVSNKDASRASDKDVTHWLKTISSQLERLIICEEKKLSGQVLKNFNSKQHLKLNKEV